MVIVIASYKTSGKVVTIQVRLDGKPMSRAVEEKGMAINWAQVNWRWTRITKEKFEEIPP